MSVSQSKNKLRKEIKDLHQDLELMKNDFKREKAELDIFLQKVRDNERMLHTLIEAAVGDIGQDFFNNIVTNLSEWLNAEIVLIGQMIEPNKITALPLYYDGEISEGFSYDLEGSPCDITKRKGFCSYSEDVIDLFPKDKLLVDMNAVGYIGTALYNKEGAANGVICALSRKKLEVPPQAQDILKIIGARVTAEIERKKAEEALTLSEAELRETNATKDKFFSIIAHDLKGPFQTILGFSELLLENYHRYDEQKRLKYINLIYQSGRNTHGLLENLLTWSRSQRGTIAYAPNHIELSSFVQKNINVIKKMAKEKYISLNIAIPDDVIVLADEDMLATIIRNLLSNAIKFTEEGGTVSITGSFKNGSNKTKNVEIVVEDTGTGIEKNRLKTLFEEDKNTSTPGTKTEKGTGLGLLLCKEFIDRHSGKIEVDSKPGLGSRFIVTL